MQTNFLLPCAFSSVGGGQWRECCLFSTLYCFRSFGFFLMCSSRVSFFLAPVSCTGERFLFAVFAPFPDQPHGNILRFQGILLQTLRCARYKGNNSNNNKKRHTEAVSKLTPGVRFCFPFGKIVSQTQVAFHGGRVMYTCGDVCLSFFSVK